MPTEGTDYGLSKQVSSARIAAPALEYLPRVPRRYRPKIGVVGAGGVTEYHLKAYQKLGLDVALICDLNLSAPVFEGTSFFPPQLSAVIIKKRFGAMISR